MAVDYRGHLPLKTEARRLADGLFLYKQPKRPGRGSPNWYVRARIDLGQRKVHTKSTGTSDVREATDRARDYFSDLMIQKRGGILPQSKLSDRAYRFDVVADTWLDSLQQMPGEDERRARRYRDHRKILQAPNGLLAFFRQRDVRTINPKAIEDYVTFASNGSGKPGGLRPSTKKNHLATLSKLLNFALDHGRLERLPRFPTIKMKDDPRPALQDSEYKALLTVCRSFERHMARCGYRFQMKRWQELRDFIVFMVNSFLRPSEWVQLRQKDIEIVDGDNPYLRITVRRGKTKKRIAVTMRGAVVAYRRILKRCGVDPERFVFMPGYPNRATALERMRDWFKAALEQSDLTYDPFGRRRTLYSLRHTALTLRVLKGDNVDLLTLARNAGTSIRMLERFYCSHLHAEQKIANLQSFRSHPASLVPVPASASLRQDREEASEERPLLS